MDAGDQTTVQIHKQKSECSKLNGPLQEDFD